MKNIIFLVTALLLLSACSFKTPDNSWQFKSSSAFESYKKNFLYGYDKLANNDLERAINHAKMSSDFTTLARIYLGECALNISVGIKDRCHSYKSIANIVQDVRLEAYYAFITASFDEKDIEHLPKTYQKFALNILDSHTHSAIEHLSNMEKISSKLLSAAIIEEKLPTTTIQNIIKSASFHGYKRAVIHWLKILQEKTTDIDKKKVLNKKLSILESS